MTALQRWLCFATALAALSVAVLCAAQYARLPIASALGVDTPKGHGTWEDRIGVVGAPAAYDEFVRSVAGKDPEEEHELAHAFGDALYAVEGQSGLSVCDGRASYGCYHAIVGHTIAERGLDEVGVLVRYCHTSPGTNPFSCQHGIGHGLVGHFGYDTDDLGSALEVCKDKAVQDVIDSCYSGAFMEYNMRTMLGSAAAIRPVGGNALTPCDTVAPEYKRACAFQEPQWWLQALAGADGPDAGTYATMGALCDKLGTTPSVLRACYEGLGEHTPAAANYSPDTAAVLCAASSSSALGRLFCVSYAASGIADRRGSDEGLKACAALSGAEHAYCGAYVAKYASSINPMSAPAL